MSWYSERRTWSSLVEVEPDHHVVADQAVLQISRVAAGLLVLLVEGKVVQRREVPGEVGFPAQDLQVPGLQADDLRLHVVDVGELVAGGVHLPEIGIALEQLRGRIAVREDPRVHPRRVHVARRPPVRVKVERLRPALEPFLLGDRRRIVVVVGMPLLQVVLRRVEGALLGGTGLELRFPGRDRSGRQEAHGFAIDLLDLHELAVDDPGPPRVRPKLRVLLHVVPHEEDVVRGHRFTVRPLQPPCAAAWSRW